MNTYEQGYLAAGDRLRELRRRLDAVARQYQRGEPVDIDQANRLQAEFRQAETDYFRAKGHAEQATKARETVHRLTETAQALAALAVCYPCMPEAKQAQRQLLRAAERLQAVARILLP